MCLSKGIGAPVGSILAGDQTMMARARRYRKAIGGCARQIGFMAAAANVALENPQGRIQRDHEHAKIIAKGLLQNNNEDNNNNDRRRQA